MKKVELPLSRREANKRTKEQALFDSAMLLFARSSYQEVSVEEICEHAGYGRTTFYRLFGEKAALLEELNRRLAAHMHARLSEEQARGAEALQLAISVMNSEVTRYGAVAAEMIFEYIRVVDRFGPQATGYREGAVALASLFSKCIREGQEDGAFRDSHRPEDLAGMVLGQISLSFIDWAREARPTKQSLRARLDRTTDFALFGLASKQKRR